MNISVILCTYNRCEMLARALDSVLASELPSADRWELLVVDNNSKDQTRAVVENAAAKFPDRIRYISEPAQGKSNALNRGIREAHGEILAFVDDDIQVDKYWLHKLCAPLENPSYAGVGGRIIPPQGFSPPPWLPMRGEYSLGGILAFFDFGDAAQELREPPFGTNMAFRKETFAKHGNFRADLGPMPGTEIRGEDTEFGRRVMKAGERLWYAPDAIVYHPVAEKRLNQKYFLQFLYDQGRALVRERQETPGRRRVTFLRLVFRSTPRRLYDWLSAFDPGERFSSKGMVWMTFGQIAEIWNGGSSAKKSS
jgi:GT2 family glycosyltransferase